MPALISTSRDNTLEIKRPELPLIELLPVLLIAGLGFFVDVYDLAIFAAVRVASLAGLSVPNDQILSTGIFILNIQMIGMILGGFAWGILGDKKGRKFSLFGSILLYSLATFFNGFVHSVPTYALLRFLAGIGLAGEVGAAVLIVAEVTPAKYRAYSTGAVRAMGLLGAILAGFVGDRLPWRLVYITAGLAGIILLLARISIKETGLFLELVNKEEIKRGSIKLFLSGKARLLRLIRCVVAAIPQWFLHGVLIAFAPEICRASSQTVAITAGTVMIYSSCGQSVGEFFSCVLSQFMRSRKLPMAIFLIVTFILTVILLKSPPQYYTLLFIPIGFFTGYCSLVLTTSAEQFGTNLRSTATTLVPNFFRASVIPITLLFSNLTTGFGTISSAMITGTICFLLALFSILTMEETYAKELNFLEE